MKHKAGSSEFFVITGLIFEDHEEAELCDAAIDSLRAKLRVHPRFEFHFNSCCDAWRSEFLRTVALNEFFCYSLVLNKKRLWSQGFHDKHSMYKYTTSLVFENAKPILREAKVVIDRCGNREFRDQMAKYLKRKMNAPGSCDLIKSVSMEPSHSNNLLQMADMVCGATARSFADREDRRQFRDLIRHREMRVQVWPK